MAATFIRLARDEPVELRDEYDAVEDRDMLRDIDNLPHLFHASEFFDNVEDTWQAPGFLRPAIREQREEQEPWRTSQSTKELSRVGPTSELGYAQAGDACAPPRVQGRSQPT